MRELQEKLADLLENTSSTTWLDYRPFNVLTRSIIIEMDAFSRRALVAVVDTCGIPAGVAHGKDLLGRQTGSMSIG